jgi:hypothetical protein
LCSRHSFSTFLLAQFTTPFYAMHIVHSPSQLTCIHAPSLLSSFSHHAHGPIVEYAYPPFPGQSERSVLTRLEVPEEWSLLPFLALPGTPSLPLMVMGCVDTCPVAKKVDTKTY